MMKTFGAFLLVVCFLTFNFLSNAQDAITRPIPAFNSLSIIGKLTVELYKSDTLRVELFPENLPESNIITTVKDSTLSIRLRTDSNKSASVRILVYYSDLKSIEVASNTLLVSPQVLKAENIKFEARSGAKMELELDVVKIKADAKQGGILVFSGKTNRQDITVNTGGVYSAYSLKSEDTYVTALAGSKAKVCASRIIDANSNAKSYIGYIGTPVSVYIKTNLGGQIASFANEDAVFENQE